jgi:antitoxin (DNA-binding transcriptional repressor) of toxin-antitoxin stability system
MLIKMINMNTITITTTELKHNTGELLDLVSRGQTTIIIKRYGKAIARIKADKSDSDYAKFIGHYQGAIPDFPDVTKDRTANSNRFNPVL